MLYACFKTSLKYKQEYYIQNIFFDILDPPLQVLEIFGRDKYHPGQQNIGAQQHFSHWFNFGMQWCAFCRNSV